MPVVPRTNPPGNPIMGSLKTDYATILRLAIPISAGTFMQFLVVLTDNFFLSRTSDAALNGAGNAGILYITLGMIGAGFCNTGQILIARRVGEGQPDAALGILRSGLAIMAGTGLLLVGVMHLLLLTGIENVFQDVATGAVFAEFMAIRRWGYLPAFMMMMLNAFFMGTARSRILMWAMVTTGLVNIIGDAALISGQWGFPAMGPRGAAWASFTAECTGLFVLLGCAMQRHGRALRSAAWMAGDALGRWARLALPMILQMTLTLGTWSMFFFLVEQVGVMELKVSHIARNFFMLAFVIAQGVQQTTRTLVSGLLGEGRREELVPTMRRLMLVNACGILLVSHGGLFYPEFLAAPFFDDHLGLEAACRTLPVIFLAMMMYSISSVLLSSVQGSGHTTPALAIEASALVLYTAVSIWMTLIDPQPVWRIWWVEWIYFSGMGAGCLLFLTRWDWRSKSV